MEAVRQIIQQETDSIPEQVLILKGGDINQVFHCLLIDKQFVIKLNNSKQFPEMFEKESKGLQLLSQSKFIIPKTKAARKAYNGPGEFTWNYL